MFNELLCVKKKSITFLYVSAHAAVSAYRPHSIIQPVDLKLWRTRSTTTPPIGLAKKRRKCAFRNPITRFVCSNRNL